MRNSICIECNKPYVKPKQPGSFLYCEECREAIKRRRIIRYCWMCGVEYEKPKQSGSFLYCVACREKGVSKEIARVYRQNIRAHEVHLIHDLTIQQWLETLQYFEWKCAFCGGEYQVLEHYGPLIQGYGTTWTNCAPACKDCNARKSGKTIEEFRTLFSATALEAIEEYLEDRRKGKINGLLGTR